MFTNTYFPHVGGVAESIRRLAEDCRAQGHAVCVVTPEYPGSPENEEDVIRVPALQNFNGSDFSVSLPAPFLLSKALDAFQPDIIHAHHPYLVGDTALRVSAHRNLPLVLTYHTIYEEYTHYVPVDSPQFKRFVIELTSGFANLCDHIIAPSQGVAEILYERHITTPVTVIPTGLDIERFAHGDGLSIRHQYNIPREAFLVGHVGRLAPEKNLIFLSKAVAQFLRQHEHAYFLVVGWGKSRSDMEELFQQAGVRDRVHFADVQRDQALVDHYHAMDVFAFASKTETQGMVLTEAMAAGNPVVALDATGVGDVVEDRKNGRLLQQETPEEFCRALEEFLTLPQMAWQEKRQAAEKTARKFSRESSFTKIIDVYSALQRGAQRGRGLEDDTWDALLRSVKQEWEIWSNRVSAGIEALTETPPETL
jgi:glycosyltransferase involved in cell wall biosynthesis